MHPKTRGSTRWDVRALVALALLGCSSEPSSALPAPECTPGASLPCACADGRSGAQVCRDDRALEACRCSGSESPPPAGPTPAGTLSVVSLTSTSQRLTGGKPLPTETESVTFVAIVIDGKGLDHIAGGHLVDESGATYAPFGAGATKGTYAATLTFAAMNQVRIADFPVGGGSRKFSARFFDNDGNTATASIDLALACRDERFGLVGSCGGICTDVATDGSSCGKCGTACGAGQRCNAGLCGAQTADECLHKRWFGPNTTCAAVCAQRGEACGFGQWAYYQPICQTGFGPANACAVGVADYFKCICAP
jgi:hypothetical protein